MKSNYSQQEAVAPPKKNSQLKALFLKNGLLQAKQPCTNVCQVMTPVICLIFTYLIKTLAADNLPNGNLYNDSAYPYVFGDYTLLDQYSHYLLKNGTRSNSPSRTNPLEWYLYTYDAANTNATLLGTNDGLSPAPLDGSILGSVPNLNNLLPDYSPDYYADPLATQNRYYPFFQLSTAPSLNQDLFDRITLIEKNSF